MANSNTKTLSTRARIGWLVLLSLILVSVSVSAVFADFTYLLTDPGSIKQYSWAPHSQGGFPKWTNGDNVGWAEGETAAMIANIVGEQGVQHSLPICLEVLKGDAYGFVGFAPFDTEFAHLTATGRTAPTKLPDGEDLDLTDSNWDPTPLSGLVYGYQIDILGVTAPVYGLPNCYANEIGIVVDYVALSDSGYIAWGGTISKVGDIAPDGNEVLEGHSARFINGTFLARLRTLAADKTLPFKVESAPNAVELSSFGATAAQALPYGLALLGLAATGAAGLAIRRRK
jgi:hypothetical protein